MLESLQSWEMINICESPRMNTSTFNDLFVEISSQCPAEEVKIRRKGLDFLVSPFPRKKIQQQASQV